MSSNSKLTTIAISVFLFALSLTQPAFYIDRADYAAWSSSIILILTGWLGALLGGGAALAWFANPLLLLSWALFNKYSRASIFTSSLASIAAISFFTSEKVISSEAPTYSTITEYKEGYWLWLTSILFFTVSTIYSHLQRNNSK